MMPGVRSARYTAATAATGAVAGVRLAAGAIRIAFDPDHRQDDDGRRLAMRVGMFGGTQMARLVREPDNFAHCSPFPFRRVALWIGRIGALVQLKGPKVNGPLTRQR